MKALDLKALIAVIPDDAEVNLAITAFADPHSEGGVVWAGGGVPGETEVGYRWFDVGPIEEFSEGFDRPRGDADRFYLIHVGTILGDG